MVTFKRIVSLVTDRHAVTAIEYALIAAFIAVAIVTAVTGAGHNLSNEFGRVAAEL